jgi:hypothetical protein
LPRAMASPEQCTPIAALGAGVYAVPARAQSCMRVTACAAERGPAGVSVGRKPGEADLSPRGGDKRDNESLTDTSEFVCCDVLRPGARSDVSAADVVSDSGQTDTDLRTVLTADSPAPRAAGVSPLQRLPAPSCRISNNAAAASVTNNFRRRSILLTPDSRTGQLQRVSVDVTGTVNQCSLW